ncbi:uncharacterized protein KQ657_003211 [Scheffersomyces spartinae]|uniref:Uncharacterized protein n=1 Tax=Scheffersomyces spartinae TaxID=45513 RepID=A0A9P7VCP5_9ASCO|nr:uncharacterized protein KQ657_003211 [Scheffersomyces spartinae]KAG7195449.1 hypothetical protein KQ657_003211 [Scheffersomyces spartinae]
MDDLVLPSKQYHVERRARSTSPVKTRKQMPLHQIYTTPLRGSGGSNGSLVDSLDIHSISSKTTSHLSADQLKQLSKSPISKRLHVSTNEKYVIPIPFTLQLPPKLSPKNLSKGGGGGPRTPIPSEPPSPLSAQTSKRTRLVYTGQKYEMLDDSDANDELCQSSSGCSPRSSRLTPLPKRPTKFAISKSKVNVPIKDNLSIIEEVSVNGSSRQSSIRDFPPPVPPKDIAKEIPSDIAKLKLLVQPQPVKATTTELTLATVTERKSIENNNSNNKSQLLNPFHTLDPNSNSNNHNPPSLSYAPDIPHSNKDLKHLEYIKFLPSPFVENSDRKISNSSSSTVSELNNTLSDMQEEYIRYRTILELREQAKNAQEIDNDKQAREEYEQYIKKKLLVPIKMSDNTRNVSGQSTSTTTSSNGMSSGSEALSTSSWNSLQRSIEISIAELSQKDINITRNESGQSEISIDYGSWEDASSEEQSNYLDDINDETLILKIASDEPTTKSTEEKVINDDQEQSPSTLTTIEPLTIRKLIKTAMSPSDNEENKQAAVTIDKSLISDNEGVGRSFYFPNNLTNATNDEQVKKRSDGFEAKHKLRKSFMSTTGQIEIPNIAELSLSNSEEEAIEDSESEGDETTKELKLNLAPDSDSQTQLDYDYDYCHAELKNQRSPMGKSESAPLLNQLTTSLTPSAAQRRQSMSPARHQRSRSVFNISNDFNDLYLSPKAELISKESLGISDSLAPPCTPSSTKDVESTTIKSVESEKEISPPSRTISTPKELPIIVAEPPKKVEYDVDFKELSMEGDEFHSNKMSSGPSVMEIYANFITEQPHKRPITTTKNLQPPSLNEGNRLNNGVTSISSYQSSRSYKGTASSYTTQDDDAESVVIDLTKERYNVTHIQRNDSILSYKSVTERTKDGKLVEVVLVDEDDGPATNKDELESLYSKYRHFNFAAGSSQYQGDFETSSLASFTNSVSSSQRLCVKRKDKVETAINLKNVGQQPKTSSKTKTLQKAPSSSSSTTSSNSSRVSVAYKSSRIKLPENRLLESKMGSPISVSPSPISDKLNSNSPISANSHISARHSPISTSPVLTKDGVSLSTPKKKPLNMTKKMQPNSLESNYFDYTSKEKYDFKSFMKGRTII